MVGGLCLKGVILKDELMLQLRKGFFLNDKMVDEVIRRPLKNISCM